MVNMITDLYLADIVGTKSKIMVGFFRELYKKNKDYLKAIRYNNWVDPKTGLSIKQRQQILAFPRFTIGETDFFNNKISYSDSLGFIHSVEEMFAQDLYKFESTKSNPYIIDCGANIGLSILYFKKLFPDCRILAFEPDKNTFEILKKNVAQFSKSVEFKEVAVWSSDTTLQFFVEGSLAGSLLVDFANKNNVLNVKASDLKKYMNEEIDFLKIDIEGAENTLIFDIAEKLVNVKNLFLEYHGIIGAEQNLGEILNLLKSAGFQYYIRLAGETINFPFLNEIPTSFNQQLNILSYRR